MELSTLAMFCAPALPTAVVMAFCPVPTSAGQAVAVRPPALAFSIVWPILFAGLGVALVRAEVKWPILLLSLGLAGWQLVYSEKCGGNKRHACWALAGCVFLGLIAFGQAACDADLVSITATAALLAWLFFAQLMGALEVQVLAS